jgi:hypothetical protein
VAGAEPEDGVNGFCPMKTEDEPQIVSASSYRIAATPSTNVT